jgi:hypothetical protein
MPGVYVNQSAGSYIGGLVMAGIFFVIAAWILLPVWILGSAAKGGLYLLEKKYPQGILMLCLSIFLLTIGLDLDYMSLRGCSSRPAEVQKTACSDWSWNSKRNIWQFGDQHPDEDEDEDEKGGSND